jgi:hypothetical protein
VRQRRARRDGHRGPQWVLSHVALRPSLSVLVLEATQFNPTLLSPADAAVTPRAVTNRALHTYEWADGPSRGEGYLA